MFLLCSRSEVAPDGRECQEQDSKRDRARRHPRDAGRLYGPPAPPFVPKRAGCNLKGLHNPKPGGGFIRIIAVSGKQWGNPDEFVCENCLKARTGFNPNDLL